MLNMIKYHDDSFIDSLSLYCVVAECPAGFVLVNGGNNCYKAGTYPHSWSDAAESCRSFHPYSHLVVIDNAEEQTAVNEWRMTQEGTFQ